MIIIYNLSGLLLGLLGGLVCVFATAGTNSAGVGMLLGALIWIIGGFWWRSRSTPGRAKNAYPAIFFIPLPFAGMAVALLALGLLAVERGEAAKPSDPRATQFKSDEDRMRSNSIAGNVGLSGKIMAAVSAVDSTSKNSVFTRIENDRVLVLLKISKLKEFDDTARQGLLNLILKTVENFPDSKGKAAYVGVQGRLLYGIVHVPPNVTKIGETVPDELLYDFYSPAQPIAQPKPTAITTASSPAASS